MSMDFTEDEANVALIAAAKFGDDERVALIHAVLAAVAPRIAERAVRNLMNELDYMDEEGELGGCCANPSCRACTVLQHIAGVVGQWRTRAEAVGDE